MQTKRFKLFSLSFGLVWAASGCTAINQMVTPIVNPFLGLLTLGVFGLLCVALLLLLPILEQRIPLLKALKLTPILKKVPIIGAYFRYATSINQGISHITEQKGKFKKDRKRIRQGWLQTFSKSTPITTEAASQSVQPSSQPNQTWRPERIQMAQPTGHTTTRGFFSRILQGEPVSEEEHLVQWEHIRPTEARAVTGQTSAYEPPIGRIPVPPEFKVELNQTTNLEERALLGQRIERYQIDGILHSGTNSTVYQAYDIKIGRPVAIKILKFPAELTRSAQIATLEDMRTLSAAEHLNLTQIYDFGEEEGHLFVVTQLVRGVPIDALMTHMLQQGVPIELGRILTIAAQLAEALHELHTLGLVHGLLKPGHLILNEIDPDPQAKLLDVGFINLYPSVAEVPAAFWPYLSPEYCRTGRIDPRSDVYGLGALLYHLLTGQPLFKPTSAAHATEQHTSTSPLPPTQYNATLPAKVEEILLKALSKKPGDRYQSAGDLAAALRRVATPLDGRHPDRKFLKEGERVIYATAADQPRRSFILDKPSHFIGSDLENDFILTGVNIAPVHLRIDQEGGNCIVSQLNESAETYLEGTRMLPNLPEVWEADSLLQIGPYTLVWEEIEKDMVLTPPLEDHLQETLIGISMQPYQLALAPGEHGVIQLNLLNQAAHVDQFDIAVEQIPPEWVQISLNQPTLLPGDQINAILSFQLPPDTTAAPGDYPFVVKITPRNYPDRSVTARSILQVKPLVDVQSALSIEQLRNRGSFEIAVACRGNTAAQLTIEIDEEKNPLIFNYDRQPLKVGPGEEKLIDVSVRPIRRPLLGNSRPTPFNVKVTDYESGLYEQNHTVQASITPLVPRWAVSTAGFCLMFGMLGYALFGNIIWPAAAETGEIPAASREPTDLNELDSLVEENLSDESSAPSAGIFEYPATCTEYRAQTGEEEDGEYELFLTNNPNFGTSIYCHNMAGYPLEYLTLSEDDLLNNYSTIIQDGVELRTYFKKVRIDIRTLKVIRDDFRFAGISNGAVDLSTQIRDFGTAMGCQGDNQAANKAIARIDLTETEFKIDRSTQFMLSGVAPIGSQSIDPSRQVAQLEISGNCGWIWPQGDIQLAYMTEQVAIIEE